MTELVMGFGIGLGLIVAIGAQNAWVLGMSVRRQHPWAIAIVCFSIDAALMAVGVLFFKKIQARVPDLVPALRLFAVALLLFLAVQSFRRAIRGGDGLSIADEESMPLNRAIMTALGMSLLNPHVYLDTVVLVGSLATSSSQPWLFWLGAACASVVWFLGLAAVGGWLRVWLSSPSRWRVFDSLMGLVMTWVAVTLYWSF